MDKLSSFSVILNSVPIFALLIGINFYQDPQIPNLEGCVADADDIATFLGDRLGVPSGHIMNLRNEQATRTSIIYHLRALITDERIAFEDPILIYYAGHGAQTSAPQDWPAGGDGAKVQMLLPYDFCVDNNSDENVQGILDFTLSAFLTELSIAKGNNITVIFDSCHSGSGTRSLSFGLGLVRGIDLPQDYKILPHLLSGAARSITISQGRENDGLASHVLLAACSKDEAAHEVRKRGQFTKALVAVLRDPLNRMETRTYREIIQFLPDLSFQTPQCEGKHCDRTLFGGKVLSLSRMLHLSTKSKSPDGTLNSIVHTGEAEGITEGAYFHIYAKTEMSLVPVSRMLAFQPRVCSTVLKLPLTQVIPSRARVLQAHTSTGGDFSVAFQCESNLVQSILERTNKDTGYEIVPVLEHESATLTVAEEGQNVVFKLTDSLCCQNNLEHLPYMVPSDADYLFPVLKHAADFFHALKHSRKSERNLQLSTYIALEAYELTSKNDFLDGRHLAPVGKNLHIDNHIRIPINGIEARYGFRITSTYMEPLYVWLFSFDMSDLSIDVVYQPNIAKKADPCLRAKSGELTIGYGAGGAQPQSFYLDPDMDTDVTYLKLFLTTRYMDFSHLKASSPFDSSRRSVPNPLPLPDLWDTLVVPIIQERNVSVQN